MFHADAAAAIAWLERAFGFTVRLKVEGPDGAILHSEFEFAGDGLLMLGQSGLRPERDHCQSPQTLNGANTQGLAVYVDDVEALKPDHLDNEHLRQLLCNVLPGRLAGNESYLTEILDLLEEFLMFVADQKGLALQWERVSALGQHRAGFEEALANEDRPVLAPPDHEPDRRPAPKVGRNDPCTCGSGKKFKHCCIGLLRDEGSEPPAGR